MDGRGVVISVVAGSGRRQSRAGARCRSRAQPPVAASQEVRSDGQTDRPGHRGGGPDDLFGFAAEYNDGPSTEVRQLLQGSIRVDGNRMSDHLQEREVTGGGAVRVGEGEGA